MIGDTLYGTCAKALGEGAVIFRPSAYPCEDLTSPAAENLLARPVEAPLEQSVPESDPPMRDEDVESRIAAIVAGFETEAAPAEPADADADADEHPNTDADAVQARSRKHDTPLGPAQAWRCGHDTALARAVLRERACLARRRRSPAR